MSYVRISQFTQRDEPGAGSEWFTRDGTGEFVRIDRDASGGSLPFEPESRALVSWAGCRTRAYGERRNGAITYLLKYPVPLDYLYEFDAWFHYEHMPILLEEKTWYGCDFYRSTGISMYTFAAIHHLEPAALKSAARDRSISTPWWNRLKQYAWFDKGFVRAILRRI
ncbi:MAG TPA: hypothetical protein VMV45_09865 [Casimicrobiaceae bacterium]|nr:hypothetical protein [Casimicrobiaceae bacterium]